MEKLKRERTILRRQFSLLTEDFQQKLSAEAHPNVLAEEFNCCSDRAESLFKVDESIKQVWLEDEQFHEDKFSTDCDKALEYKVIWIKLKTRYQRNINNRNNSVISVNGIKNNIQGENKSIPGVSDCLNQSESNDLEDKINNNDDVITCQKSIQGENKSILGVSNCLNQSESNDLEDKINNNDDVITCKKFNERRFKLPIFERKKYGEINDWLNFWGQFRKTHEDTEIDDELKVHYLIQDTELGSKARELVDSSDSKYFRAIEHLKSRFARKDLLVQTYARGLLNIVLQRIFLEIQSIQTLYDNSYTQLRVLEPLGVTINTYTDLLYAIPHDMLKAWEMAKDLLKIKEYIAIKDPVEMKTKQENEVELQYEFKIKVQEQLTLGAEPLLNVDDQTTRRVNSLLEGQALQIALFIKL